MKKLFSLFLLSFALATSAQAKEKDVEQEALNVVGDFLGALQKGDQARLAALLDRNVIWHQPGNNKFTGVKKGAKSVLKMIGGMYEVSQGTFQLSEIKWMSANGNTVGAVLHFKANRPGAVMDTDSIDVYTVKNGKIVEAYLFTEKPDMEDEFLGRR